MNPALSATLLVLFIAGLLLVLVNFGGCVEVGQVEMPGL